MKIIISKIKQFLSRFIPAPAHTFHIKIDELSKNITNKINGLSKDFMSIKKDINKINEITTRVTGTKNQLIVLEQYNEMIIKSILNTNYKIPLSRTEGVLEFEQEKVCKRLKIGILSINFQVLNFACALHSLVFQKVLSELGYENVIIKYSMHWDVNTPEELKYPLIKCINDKNKTFLDKQKRIEELSKRFYQQIERFEKFDFFIKKHCKLTENSYTASSFDLMSNAEDINCFIVATDVVWKSVGKIGFDKGFFLACRAMKDAYKIAYSASRGQSKYETEELQNKFLEYIKNIDVISVREQGLADYISSVSDIKAEVVLDPVFLVKREFYDEILIPPKKEGYVLVYIVIDKADELSYLAAKYAQAQDMDLIELSIFDYHKQQTGYSRHRVIYNIGPDEWIGYIKHAEYVFTNSFHGACFSIIFEKQFFTWRRGDKVDNLLKTFELEYRKTEQAFDENTNIIVHDIDYTAVNQIRKKLVIKSLDFLKKSLRKAEEFIENKKISIENPNYLNSKNKALCCGCTACEKICPINAIMMIQDDEGFYFPEINVGKCNRCGLCNKVCPMSSRKELYSRHLEVYLAYNLNPDDRRNSSSGGIFAAIAEYILKCGGAVIGVRFNERYEALYDIAENAEDCLKFRFSKYVEAADNDIYSKTKAVLQSGRKVLFTGTPCKVSGLINYLGFDREYNNLYCADFICGGTNSPVILSKYIEEKTKNKLLKSFQFRTPRAPQGPVTVEFIYEDGESEILNKHNGQFIAAFLKGIIFKRSCYKCKFCGNNGISDITYGDFWGGEKFYSGDDIKKGISCVKVNTSKGKELFENMNVYVQEQTVEDMYAKNRKNPKNFPEERNKIFDWINKENLSVIEALDRALRG